MSDLLITMLARNMLIAIDLKRADLTFVPRADPPHCKAWQYSNLPIDWKVKFNDKAEAFILAKVSPWLARAVEDGSRYEFASDRAGHIERYNDIELKVIEESTAGNMSARLIFEVRKLRSTQPDDPMQ